MLTGMTEVSMLDIGQNCVDVLREIGVYDDIAKYLPEPSQRKSLGFMVVMGNDIHDHVYTVSYILIISGSNAETLTSLHS